MTDKEKIYSGLRNIAIAGVILLGGLTVKGILYNKPEYKEKLKEKKYIDSIYQEKEDSLANAYRLQLGTLNKNHINDLKNIERKFKK
jgi:hypothetical protein